MIAGETNGDAGDGEIFMITLSVMVYCVFLGSSGHKNESSGNGRPAPLLAEPRYGAAPQPYGNTRVFT